MNAPPPAKKTEKAPPDNVEKGYAKKADAARGKKKMSQKLTAVGAIGGAISTEVQKVIIGKAHVIDNVLVDILSNGNLLFEDYPGLAKTLMTNTFADALGCDFKRVQFTPDLLPADITGTNIYDAKKGEFTFKPGPIFCNLLLSDEINRAPPKTQAALLEAMQELQVTVGVVTHKLPAPFLTMATQNPIEQEGTYPLPEAQMDRFLMKMSMGYPSMDEEKAILQRRKLRAKDGYDVEQVVEPRKVVAMQKALETVHIDPAILGYIVQVVQRTRADPRIEAGASPRASQGLFKASRASAAIDGRDYVIPDDVKGVALDVVSHRIVLKPESKIRGVTGRRVVNKILSEVNVPVIQ